MKKHLYKRGQQLGNWTLVSYLGGGGNGEVWICKDSDDNRRAIKILKSPRPKPYSRFLDEIKVVEENSDIEGILPIEDKYLPKSIEGEIAFYVMPIAEPAESKIKGRKIEEKINAVIEIATTLEQLHHRGIAHRDIKPANILFYNSRYTIADFGLVDYPDKKEISVRNEEIGPKWTMAPEMRRESTGADGLKADVYSLAKTLWIILTENIKGFDGQYSINSIIELKKFYSESYTSPIDNLLISCTDNDPQRRPNISEFIGSLREWLELNEDFHLSNRRQWFEVQTQLFPASLPNRVIWDNIDEIVKILKVVSSISNLNHMFFPRSGGLDLEDARRSYEEDCIELDCQLIYIVKPKRLLFESFNQDPEWNYFRLETGGLEPTGINDNDYTKEHKREDVSELSPGNYYKYDIMEYPSEYRDEYDITDFSRHVTRYFEGSFVFFCKRSSYNLSPATYDGRHDKMTTDEFRKYIQRQVDYNLGNRDVE